MAAANGSLSPDDELRLDPVAAEPPAFEFQSDLTDDDDDDEEHDDNGNAPDPLALDEVASASLALAGSLETPVKTESKSPPPGPTIEEEEKGEDVGVNGAAAAETAAAAATEEEEAEEHKQKSDVRFVDVEVSLPWMSPSRRAEYEHVEVGEYLPPPEDEYHRPRRRRHRVSKHMPSLRFGLFGLGNRSSWTHRRKAPACPGQTSCRHQRSSRGEGAAAGGGMVGERAGLLVSTLLLGGLVSGDPAFPRPLTQCPNQASVRCQERTADSRGETPYSACLPSRNSSPLSSPCPLPFPAL